MFGWPDPKTGFDQSEHALYTCYFINSVLLADQAVPQSSPLFVEAPLSFRQYVGLVLI